VNPKNSSASGKQEHSFSFKQEETPNEKQNWVNERSVLNLLL